MARRMELRIDEVPMYSAKPSLVDRERRRFLGTAMGLAVAELVAPGSVRAQSTMTGPTAVPASGSGSNASFGPLKQIDAGVLNIGFAEAGPADGHTVILLHGWPYD